MDPDDDDFASEAPTNPLTYDPDAEAPIDYGPVESGFLHDISASPADFPLRVVYADWLEQQGDLGRATLVRLLSVDPVEGSAERAELRELGSQLPNAWLATLSRGAIDGCEQERRRRCTQRWESLASTDQPRMRDCRECGNKVVFCASLDAVHAQGEVPSRVVYSPLLDHARAAHGYDGGMYLDAGRTLRERRARRLTRVPER